MGKIEDIENIAEEFINLTMYKKKSTKLKSKSSQSKLPDFQ